MNERMWEIAEKAKDQGPNYHYYDPVFLIEYTRLVVEECASIVDGFEITQEVALDEYVDFEAGAVLKQYFGVEE